MARAVFGSAAGRVQIPPDATAWPPAGLPAADDLLLLCEHAADLHDWDLVHLFAGPGLRESGPLLARFLLFRSLALEHLRMGPAAVTCARAARHVAYRVQDARTIAALHAVFPPWLLDEEELDDAALLEALAHERSHQGPASARPQPAGAGRGRRRGRRGRRTDAGPPQRTLPFEPDHSGEIPR
jgi:hypothetical protein